MWVCQQMDDSYSSRDQSEWICDAGSGSNLIFRLFDCGISILHCGKGILSNRKSDRNSEKSGSKLVYEGSTGAFDRDCDSDRCVFGTVASVSGADCIWKDLGGG